MNIKRQISIFLTLFTILILSFGSTSYIQKKQITNSFPLEVDSTAWVDSLMIHMSLDQKIGQLFMVAAYSNKGKAHKEKLTKLIEEHGIGGLIFFQGGPVRQANLTNYFQSKAKVPLMISIDAEWGLAMRLDSTIRYPKQMMLGAINDDSLIYQMGRDIALQCKRLGIHVNLAPVVDVNNNPNNPVINSRSFGESKENVARKGIAYMKGLQDFGVIANAKHFPGHGDTDKDSHKTLPVISHSKERLTEVEFFPFRKLMQEGLGSIMIAHLYVPALDSTPNLATTLSKKIVTDLVKNEMGFGGLIFTDALNMKGVSSFYKPGEVELKALLAGNDVLLFAEDVPTAIDKIKEAIDNDEISELEINARCKKILLAKKWVELDKYKPIKIKDLHEDLNVRKYEVTKRRLIENAITLVENKKGLVPLRNLEVLKIASVAIGETKLNTFQKTLSNYTTVHHFTIRKKPTKSEMDDLMFKLKGYTTVLIGIHKPSKSPVYNFGVTKETIALIGRISKEKTTIVSLFANPYALNKFYKVDEIESIIVSYEDSELAQSYTAQAIFGGIAARGKLSVSTQHFPQGSGYQILKPVRMKYTIPEDMGLNIEDLNVIDDIAMSGVTDQAYPGCQILVAKEGAVVYQKSFGYHTYEEKITVKNDDIYDLASITKIGASLGAIMRLEDEGYINLDSTLGYYLPELLDTTPYNDLLLREILAHQSGLVSWIPFYYKTLHKGEPKFDIYSRAPSETYSVRVAEDFYIVNNYQQVMIDRILETKLGEKKYKYSDLGYYFFQRIIEKISKKPLNEFVDSVFYKQLGMSTTGYLPRNRFSLNRIPPTEYDMLFRKQLIHGDVHDPGAAMLGGVGGHAGLFSNTNDFAKLMQMYLNKGEYGGKRYLNEETLKEFSKCQFCDNHNRRGAGFDKPAPHGSPGPTCDCVSFDSFGHSGFTGTLAWADPDEKIVYIFLSNRVYPDAKNRKLISSGIRTRIMRVIYDAVRRSRGINIALDQSEN